MTSTPLSGWVFGIWNMEKSWEITTNKTWQRKPCRRVTPDVGGILTKDRAIQWHSDQSGSMIITPSNWKNPIVGYRRWHTKHCHHWSSMGPKVWALPHCFFGRQLLKTTCRDTMPLCAPRWHQHPAKEGQLESFTAQMVIGRLSRFSGYGIVAKNGNPQIHRFTVVYLLPHEEMPCWSPILRQTDVCVYIYT